MAAHPPAWPGSALTSDLVCMVLQRSFSSVSNASSEQSDSAAHAAAHLGLAGRPVSGSYQRPEGQTGQHAGPAEAPRHGTWVKGMPPSGKKKKDGSVHKAALTKLI